MLLFIFYFYASDIGQRKSNLGHRVYVEVDVLNHLRYNLLALMKFILDTNEISNLGYC